MNPISPGVTATVTELRDWWLTLNDDQQDLLQITAASLPLSPHVIDFLAATHCPLTRQADPLLGPATVTAPDQLVAFVAQAGHNFTH
jgi:hypothetical protein